MRLQVYRIDGGVLSPPQELNHLPQGQIVQMIVGEPPTKTEPMCLVIAEDFVFGTREERVPIAVFGDLAIGQSSHKNDACIDTIALSGTGSIAVVDPVFSLTHVFSVKNGRLSKYNFFYEDSSETKSSLTVNSGYMDD